MSEVDGAQRRYVFNALTGDMEEPFAPILLAGRDSATANAREAVRRRLKSAPALEEATVAVFEVGEPSADDELLGAWTAVRSVGGVELSWAPPE